VRWNRGPWAFKCGAGGSSVCELGLLMRGLLFQGGGIQSQARPSSSFYVDCTEAGRPLDLSDPMATVCSKERALFENRRMETSTFLAPCWSPKTLHNVATGEWSQCCSRKRRKGKKFYSCKPMEVVSHQYLLDGNGVAMPNGYCGSTKCEWPSAVCLRDRKIGASDMTGKAKTQCLDVGAPGSKWSKVYYLMAPLLPPDLPERPRPPPWPRPPRVADDFL